MSATRCHLLVVELDPDDALDAVRWQRRQLAVAVLDESLPVHADHDRLRRDVIAVTEQAEAVLLVLDDSSEQDDALPRTNTTEHGVT